MSLPMGLSSCYEECDTNTEFTIEARFMGTDTLPARIFALGGTGGDIGLNGDKCYLPVDLSTDITTYVFEFSDRSDTLRLWFDRDYYFQSRHCGYVINYLEGHVYEKPPRIERVTYELDFYNNQYDKDLLMYIYY
jgi:hypothetical protein